MAERGELSEADAAKFFAARTEGPAVVECMMHEARKREFGKQEEFYKRQLNLGELLLGGGLLNGVLQPFSCFLASLDWKKPFRLLSSHQCSVLRYLYHKYSLLRRFLETTQIINSNIQLTLTLEECA
jgi:hypothetical protein